MGLAEGDMKSALLRAARTSIGRKSGGGGLHQPAEEQTRLPEQSHLVLHRLGPRGLLTSLPVGEGHVAPEVEAS